MGTLQGAAQLKLEPSRIGRGLTGYLTADRGAGVLRVHPKACTLGATSLQANFWIAAFCSCAVHECLWRCPRCQQLIASACVLLCGLQTVPMTAYRCFTQRRSLGAYRQRRREELLRIVQQAHVQAHTHIVIHGA